MRRRDHRRGYAGVAAANRLPARHSVLVLDPKDAFVHRVRLHEHAAGGGARVSVPYPAILRPHVGNHRSAATGVEPGLVRLADGSEVRARQVLLATGSDRDTGGGIASLRAASAVRARVAAAGSGGRILVRGSGLTGIELAAELAHRRPDLAVHLQGRTPTGADLPDRAREHLLRGLGRLGVQVDVGTRPDLRIEATGLQLSQLAGLSALPCDAEGRMRVGPDLESLPGVWGAGDAVAVDGSPHLRASCATAIPMGTHAARNIARVLRGAPPELFSFRYRVRCLSLGRRAGLVVAVDPFDVPTGRVLAGRPAAWVKTALIDGVLRSVR